MPLVQGPASGAVRSLPARAAQPNDRFVIVAPCELDAAMVVRAPTDLDAEMVFNPETGRRGLAPGGPVPFVVPMVPGRAPFPWYFGPQP